MASRSGPGERVAGLVHGPFRDGRSLRVRAADYDTPQTSLRARARKDARRGAQNCDAGATPGSAGTQVRKGDSRGLMIERECHHDSEANGSCAHTKSLSAPPLRRTDTIYTAPRRRKKPVTFNLPVRQWWYSRSTMSHL